MKVITLLLAAAVALVQCEDDLLKAFSVGNLKFSADVYQELAKTSTGNVLVCPMSVETIFALVHAGTAGSTASQIASGFNLPESAKDIQNIFKTLSPTLQHTGNYNLSSANKVYVKNQFKIKDEFKTVAVETFNSEIQEIDFDKNENAANEINKWVEEKTYEKIKDLIQPDDINKLTRLILINAMYFKGNWIHKFKEYFTQKRPFYLNKDNKKEVETMEITKYFKYDECSRLNAKFLEMEFEGGDISMVIVLPNDKEGLSSIENQLEYALKERNSTREKVHVRLPKFKIETKIDFIPILTKLGITDAFDEGKANLSGMSADPDVPLVISKVVQKAFIEVKEDGTTAAAATAVFAIVATSALIEPPIPPKEFIAEHPFIFILKHKHGVMFIGRYNGN